MAEDNTHFRYRTWRKQTDLKVSSLRTGFHGIGSREERSITDTLTQM